MHVKMSTYSVLVDMADMDNNDANDAVTDTRDDVSVIVSIVVSFLNIANTVAVIPFKICEEETSTIISTATTMIAFSWQPAQFRDKVI